MFKSGEQLYINVIKTTERYVAMVHWQHQNFVIPRLEVRCQLQADFKNLSISNIKWYFETYKRFVTKNRRPQFDFLINFKFFCKKIWTEMLIFEVELIIIRNNGIFSNIWLRTDGQIKCSQSRGCYALPRLKIYGFEQHCKLRIE